MKVKVEVANNQGDDFIKHRVALILRGETPDVGAGTTRVDVAVTVPAERQEDTDAVTSFLGAVAQAMESVEQAAIDLRGGP